MSLRLLVLTAATAASLVLAHPGGHHPGQATDRYHLDALGGSVTQYPLSHDEDAKLSGIDLDNHDFGIRTFGSVPAKRCWSKGFDETFDVAIIGAPFDTATTYRPGARFGPGGIRQGSGRIFGGWADPKHIGKAWNTELRINPYQEQEIVDCGDVRMTYFDNSVALSTLKHAYSALLHRESTAGKSLSPDVKSVALDGKHHPRIVTLGGDHAILLPILEAVVEVYGPISVIHFDSHQDTWAPSATDTAYAQLNHGTMLWHAWKEGLIANGSSIHAGLRSPLQSIKDYEIDDQIGFNRVEAWEIDYIKAEGVVQRIKEVVGDRPCYLSIDIDVIDPAFAPATGTPEVGGWTTREMKQILHGLRDLKIVAADIVEVSPVYDTQSELTVIAAAKMVDTILGLFALTDLTK